MNAATRISLALFSGDIGALSEQDLQQLELDGLPCTEIAGGELDNAPYGIVDVLVRTGLAKSNKMAREFIANKAVSVNGQPTDSPEFRLSRGNALIGRYFVIKRGKKLFHLIKLS